MDGSELCLFVKDRAGEGQKAAKERLAAGEACGVAKVIGLSKLKANFKPHEAKRRLCASYDLFLADDRILPMLPPLLGKAFFKKKKHPIPVDLAGPTRDWAAAIRRATGATYFYLGGGACSAVRVGRSQQSQAEVAANVLAAAEGVAAMLSGKGKDGAKGRDGWTAIRSLYLKTSGSVALPLFTALPAARGTFKAPAAGAEAAAAPKEKAKKAAPAAAPAPAPTVEKAAAAPAKKRAAAAGDAPAEAPPAKRSARR